MLGRLERLFGGNNGVAIDAIPLPGGKPITRPIDDIRRRAPDLVGETLNGREVWKANIPEVDGYSLVTWDEFGRVIKVENHARERINDTESAAKPQYISHYCYDDKHRIVEYEHIRYHSDSLEPWVHTHDRYVYLGNKREREDLLRNSERFNVQV